MAPPYDREPQPASPCIPENKRRNLPLRVSLEVGIPHNPKVLTVVSHSGVPVRLAIRRADGGLQRPTQHSPPEREMINRPERLF
jgi:hypothetical protein